MTELKLKKAFPKKMKFQLNGDGNSGNKCHHDNLHLCADAELQ
jgi:hypothetical protein